mmetsp:Transcript_37190/g.93367  ORF Transcript_37190/g.93367 Transcript_37190/m.93367 type:complete len:216 (+) Transcript_37190:65-712(+)
MVLAAPSEMTGLGWLPACSGGKPLSCRPVSGDDTSEWASRPACAGADPAAREGGPSVIAWWMGRMGDEKRERSRAALDGTLLILRFCAGVPRRFLWQAMPTISDTSAWCFFFSLWCSGKSSTTPSSGSRSSISMTPVSSSSSPALIMRTTNSLGKRRASSSKTHLDVRLSDRYQAAASPAPPAARGVEVRLSTDDAGRDDDMHTFPTSPRPWREA